VNAIVEENDFQIHVAAQGMDEMIAADAEGVSVAGDDPYLEIGIGELDAGGNGGSPAVDGMKTVGIHVIGESAGAADAGHEYEILLGQAESGEKPLHGSQDGIVAASRAPADGCRRSEVLAGKRFGRGRSHFWVSKILWNSDARKETLKGLPLT